MSDAEREDEPSEGPVVVDKEAREKELNQKYVNHQLFIFLELSMNPV